MQLFVSSTPIGAVWNHPWGKSVFLSSSYLSLASDWTHSVCKMLKSTFLWKYSHWGKEPSFQFDTSFSWFHSLAINNKNPRLSNFYYRKILEILQILPSSSPPSFSSIFVLFSISAPLSSTNIYLTKSCSRDGLKVLTG